jgi:hypothetical protein
MPLSIDPNRENVTSKPGNTGKCYSLINDTGIPRDPCLLHTIL